MNFKRWVSAGTALLFFLTQGTGILPPVRAAEIPAGAFSASSLIIPPDLGTLEEFYSYEDLSPASRRPLIIQIETAHGSDEAARKIESLLNYLSGQYQISGLLLEGASEEVDPELDRYFKVPEWNRQVAEYRSQRGQLSGASLFLLGNPGFRNVSGIEDEVLYRENREAFIDVFHQRERAEAELRLGGREISNLKAALRSKPLREFLQKEEAFEAQRIPAADYFRFAAEAARAALGLNLTAPYAQVEWPALNRMARLQKIETQLDFTRIVEEGRSFKEKSKPYLRPEILEPLDRILSSASHRGFADLPRGHLRFLLERIVYSVPADFPFSSFPHLQTFFQFLVYQNEIRGEELFGELERLTQKIYSALSENDADTQKTLRDLKDFRLLDRLFELELTPEDYAKIPAGDLKRLVRSKPALESLYDKALHFYGGAGKREAAMIEKILEKAKGKEKPVVVITGGFHSPGLKEFFRANRISFAVVRPKLTEEQNREGYLNSILGKRSPLFAKATIESAQSLPVPPAILRRLGVDPVIEMEWRLESLVRADLNWRKDGQKISEQLNQSRFSNAFEVQTFFEAQPFGLRITEPRGEWKIDLSRKTASRRSEARTETSRMALEIKEIVSRIRHSQILLEDRQRLVAILGELAALKDPSAQISSRSLTHDELSRIYSSLPERDLRRIMVNAVWALHDYHDNAAHLKNSTRAQRNEHYEDALRLALFLDRLLPRNQWVNYMLALDYFHTHRLHEAERILYALLADEKSLHPRIARGSKVTLAYLRQKQARRGYLALRQSEDFEQRTEVIQKSLAEIIQHEEEAASILSVVLSQYSRNPEKDAQIPRALAGLAASENNLHLYYSTLADLRSAHPQAFKKSLLLALEHSVRALNLVAEALRRSTEKFSIEHSQRFRRNILLDLAGERNADSPGVLENLVMHGVAFFSARDLERLQKAMDQIRTHLPEKTVNGEAASPEEVGWRLKIYEYAEKIQEDIDATQKINEAVRGMALEFLKAHEYQKLEAFKQDVEEMVAGEFKGAEIRGHAAAYFDSFFESLSWTLEDLYIVREALKSSDQEPNGRISASRIEAIARSVNEEHERLSLKFPAVSAETVRQRFASPLYSFLGFPRAAETDLSPKEKETGALEKATFNQGEIAAYAKADPDRFKKLETLASQTAPWVSESRRRQIAKRVHEIREKISMFLEDYSKLSRHEAARKKVKDKNHPDLLKPDKVRDLLADLTRLRVGAGDFTGYANLMNEMERLLLNDRVFIADLIEKGSAGGRAEGADIQREESKAVRQAAREALVRLDLLGEETKGRRKPLPRTERYGLPRLRLYREALENWNRLYGFLWLKTDLLALSEIEEELKDLSNVKSAHYLSKPAYLDLLRKATSVYIRNEAYFPALPQEVEAIRASFKEVEEKIAQMRKARAYLKENPEAQPRFKTAFKTYREVAREFLQSPRNLEDWADPARRESLRKRIEEVSGEILKFEKMLEKSKVEQKENMRRALVRLLDTQRQNLLAALKARDENALFPLKTEEKTALERRIQDLTMEKWGAHFREGWEQRFEETRDQFQRALETEGIRLTDQIQHLPQDGGEREMDSKEFGRKMAEFQDTKKAARYLKKTEKQTAENLGKSMGIFIEFFDRSKNEKPYQIELKEGALQRIRMAQDITSQEQFDLAVEIADRLGLPENPSRIPISRPETKDAESFKALVSNMAVQVIWETSLIHGASQIPYFFEGVRISSIGSDVAFHSTLFEAAVQRAAAVSVPREPKNLEEARLYREFTGRSIYNKIPFNAAVDAYRRNPEFAKKSFQEQVRTLNLLARFYQGFEEFDHPQALLGWVLTQMGYRVYAMSLVQPQEFQEGLIILHQNSLAVVFRDPEAQRNVPIEIVRKMTGEISWGPSVRAPLPGSKDAQLVLWDFVPGLFQRFLRKTALEELILRRPENALSLYREAMIQDAGNPDLWIRIGSDFLLESANPPEIEWALRAYQQAFRTHTHRYPYQGVFLASILTGNEPMALESVQAGFPRGKEDAAVLEAMFQVSWRSILDAFKDVHFPQTAQWIQENVLTPEKFPKTSQEISQVVRKLIEVTVENETARADYLKANSEFGRWISALADRQGRKFISALHLPLWTYPGVKKILSDWAAEVNVKITFYDRDPFFKAPFRFMMNPENPREAILQLAGDVKLYELMGLLWYFRFLFHLPALPSDRFLKDPALAHEEISRLEQIPAFSDDAAVYFVFSLFHGAVIHASLRELFPALGAPEKVTSALWMRLAKKYEEKPAGRDARILAYLHALGADSGNEEAWIRLAELLAEKGSLNPAIAAAAQAAQINPKLPRAWEIIGQSYFRIGEETSRAEFYRKAEEALDKALRLDPQNQEYAFALAMASSKEEDRHKTAEALKQAVGFHEPAKDWSNFQAWLRSNDQLELAAWLRQEILKGSKFSKRDNPHERAARAMVDFAQQRSIVPKEEIQLQRVLEDMLNDRDLDPEMRPFIAEFRELPARFDLKGPSVVETFLDRNGIVEAFWVNPLALELYQQIPQLRPYIQVHFLELAGQVRSRRNSLSKAQLETEAKRRAVMLAQIRPDGNFDGLADMDLFLEFARYFAAALLDLQYRGQEYAKGFAAKKSLFDPLRIKAERALAHPQSDYIRQVLLSYDIRKTEDEKSNKLFTLEGLLHSPPDLFTRTILDVLVQSEKHLDDKRTGLPRKAGFFGQQTDEFMSFLTNPAYSNARIEDLPEVRPEVRSGIEEALKDLSATILDLPFDYARQSRAGFEISNEGDAVWTTADDTGVTNRLPLRVASYRPVFELLAKQGVRYLEIDPRLLDAWASEKDKDKAAAEFIRLFRNALTWKQGNVYRQVTRTGPPWYLSAQWLAISEPEKGIRIAAESALPEFPGRQQKEVEKLGWVPVLLSEDENWTAAFPNPEAPLTVEVGFGKSGNLFSNVIAHPEMNFVGIELNPQDFYEPARVRFAEDLRGETVKTIQRAGFTNVRLIYTRDTRVFPNQKSQSVDFIYAVGFNPREKIFINDETAVQEVRRLLKPGGKIYLSPTGDVPASLVSQIRSRFPEPEFTLLRDELLEGFMFKRGGGAISRGSLTIVKNIRKEVRAEGIEGMEFRERILNLPDRYEKMSPQEILEEARRLFSFVLPENKKNLKELEKQAFEIAGFNHKKNHQALNELFVSVKHFEKVTNYESISELHKRISAPSLRGLNPETRSTFLLFSAMVGRVLSMPIGFNRLRKAPEIIVPADLELDEMKSRFREWLLAEEKRNDFNFYPTAMIGTGEDMRTEVDGKKPLYVNPFLAAQEAGLESEREMSRLASFLTDKKNEVLKIEAHPAPNPRELPYLSIRLKNKPAAGEGDIYQLFLLKEKLPDPLKVTSAEREEFLKRFFVTDLEELEKFTLSQNDPPLSKHSKLAALLKEHVSNSRILHQSIYTLFSEEGARRFARFLQSNETDARAIEFLYRRLYLMMLRRWSALPDFYVWTHRGPAEIAAQEKKLMEALKKWETEEMRSLEKQKAEYEKVQAEKQANIKVFERLGLNPETADNADEATAEKLRKTRELLPWMEEFKIDGKAFFEPWFRILFARKPDGSRLIPEDAAGNLINHFDRVRRELKKVSFEETLTKIRDSVPELRRRLFDFEVLRAVLDSIDSKAHKKDPGIEELRKALLPAAEIAWDTSLSLTPTSRLYRATEVAELDRKVNEKRDEFIKQFSSPEGSLEGLSEIMVQLAQMDLVRANSIPPLEASEKLAAIELKNTAALSNSLQQLIGWLEKVSTPLPARSPEQERFLYESLIRLRGYYQKEEHEKFFTAAKELEPKIGSPEKEAVLKMSERMKENYAAWILLQAEELVGAKKFEEALTLTDQALGLAEMKSVRQKKAELERRQAMEKTGLPPEMIEKARQIEKKKADFLKDRRVEREFITAFEEKAFNRDVIRSRAEKIVNRWKKVVNPSAFPDFDRGIYELAQEVSEFLLKQDAERLEVRAQAFIPAVSVNVSVPLVNVKTNAVVIETELTKQLQKMGFEGLIGALPVEGSAAFIDHAGGEPRTSQITSASFYQLIRTQAHQEGELRATFEIRLNELDFNPKTAEGLTSTVRAHAFRREVLQFSKEGHLQPSHLKANDVLYFDNEKWPKDIPLLLIYEKTERKEIDVNGKPEYHNFVVFRSPFKNGNRRLLRVSDKGPIPGFRERVNLRQVERLTFPENLRSEVRAAGFSERMPARELLEALGLRDFQLNPGQLSGARQGPAGLMLRTLQIPREEIKEGEVPQGLQILHNELPGAEKFDLIFNSKGNLIAVFPVPGSVGSNLKYLDLSAFYFDLPKMRTPFPYWRKVWHEFSEEWKADQAALQAYKGSLPEQLQSAEPLERKKAYGYVEINKKTGERRVAGFNPDEFDSLIEKIRPNRSFHQIIFPVFPTIYSPVDPEHFESDDLYYSYLYKNKDFPIRKRNQVLIVGPGAGKEVWIAALQTKNTVYTIGKNPLEVANVRATARTGGFEVNAVAADNIISEEGKPVFDSLFDRVVWNMPSALFDTPPVPEERTLTRYWDRDYNGAALRRFARGLPLVTKAAMLSVIWNISSYLVLPQISESGERPAVDAVREILRTAGRFDPVTLKEEKWKPGEYKGELSVSKEEKSEEEIQRGYFHSTVYLISRVSAKRGKPQRTNIRPMLELHRGKIAGEKLSLKEAAELIGYKEESLRGYFSGHRDEYGVFFPHLAEQATIRAAASHVPVTVSWAGKEKGEEWGKEKALELRMDRDLLARIKERQGYAVIEVFGKSRLLPLGIVEETIPLKFAERMRQVMTEALATRASLKIRGMVVERDEKDRILIAGKSREHLKTRFKSRSASIRNPKEMAEALAAVLYEHLNPPREEVRSEFPESAEIVIEPLKAKDLLKVRKVSTDDAERYLAGMTDLIVHLVDSGMDKRALRHFLQDDYSAVEIDWNQSDLDQGNFPSLIDVGDGQTIVWLLEALSEKFDVKKEFRTWALPKNDSTGVWQVHVDWKDSPERNAIHNIVSLHDLAAVLNYYEAEAVLIKDFKVYFKVEGDFFKDKEGEPLGISLLDPENLQTALSYLTGRMAAREREVEHITWVGAKRAVPDSMINLSKDQPKTEPQYIARRIHLGQTRKLEAFLNDILGPRWPWRVSGETKVHFIYKHFPLKPGDTREPPPLPVAVVVSTHSHIFQIPLLFERAGATVLSIFPEDRRAVDGFIKNYSELEEYPQRITLVPPVRYRAAEFIGIREIRLVYHPRLAVKSAGPGVKEIIHESTFDLGQIAPSSLSPTLEQRLHRKITGAKDVVQMQMGNRTIEIPDALWNPKRMVRDAREILLPGMIRRTASLFFIYASMVLLARAATHPLINSPAEFHWLFWKTRVRMSGDFVSVELFEGNDLIYQSFDRSAPGLETASEAFAAVQMALDPGQKDFLPEVTPEVLNDRITEWLSRQEVRSDSYENDAEFFYREVVVQSRNKIRSLIRKGIEHWGVHDRKRVGQWYRVLKDGEIVSRWARKLDALASLRYEKLQILRNAKILTSEQQAQLEKQKHDFGGKARRLRAIDNEMFVTLGLALEMEMPGMHPLEEEKFKKGMKLLAEAVQISRELHPEYLRSIAELSGLVQQHGLEPRAEVRSEFSEQERIQMRPEHYRSELKNIVKTGGELLNLSFLPEDLEVLRQVQDQFPVLSEVFRIPQAWAAEDQKKAFEAISQKAEGIFSLSTLPSLKPQWGLLPAAKATPPQKMGYVLGPEIFRELGPAFAGLQKLYGSDVRFAVVAPERGQSPETYMDAVNAFNQELPEDQQIRVYTDAHAAVNALKRKFPVTGLGVKNDSLIFERLKEDLLQYVIWTQSQVDTFAAGFPGLKELLSEFSVAFQKAIETAA